MHTPGPWVARMVEPQEWEVDAPGGDPAIGLGRWSGLAVVHGCDDEPDHGAESARSNARLIAAAPDLLEALVKARAELAGLPRSLGYEFTHLREIDAAIAKATQP